MASTEPLTSLARRAADGELPEWAAVSEPRRAHIERVSALMAGWADALGLPSGECARWRAAARLHDCLRNAEPGLLRTELPPPLRDLPGPLLHGPAAAERLADHVDAEIAQAVRYHTLGHASFGALGKALYLADFLEPGREFEPEWRAALRERMPAEFDAVVVEVLAARIGHLLDRAMPIRPETLGFWNSLVGACG